MELGRAGQGWAVNAIQIDEAIHTGGCWCCIYRPHSFNKLLREDAARRGGAVLDQFSPNGANQSVALMNPDDARRCIMKWSSENV